MNRFDSVLSMETLASQVKGSALKSAIKNIPKQLINLSLIDLEKSFIPTDLDRIIKNDFWSEYQRARAVNKKMDLNNVYKENCSYTHWYSNIIGNPMRLLWILSPLNELTSEITSIKYLILSGAKEILDLPISDENGTLDYKVMEAKFNIFRALLDIGEVCRYNSGNSWGMNPVCKSS